MKCDKCDKEKPDVKPKDVFGRKTNLCDDCWMEENLASFRARVKLRKQSWKKRSW